MKQVAESLGYQPKRIVETAPAKGCFYLSQHAHFRVLERTALSGSQIIERLNSRACSWLRRRSSLDSYYALVYCAMADVFVVAVIAPEARVLKTILTREQWEQHYGDIATVHLALSKLAAAQSLQTAAFPAKPIAEAVLAPAPDHSVPELTTGLHLHVWVEINFAKHKGSLVHLGRIPIVEIQNLLLGPRSGSFPKTYRRNVAKLICARPFFQDWFEAQLAELGALLPESTEFFLGFNKRFKFATTCYTLEPIGGMIRDMCLSGNIRVS